MDDKNRLITITEAADQLRTPVATLRYWRHLGIGPRSFKIGRKVMYRQRDIDDWLDAQHGGKSARADERAVAPSWTTWSYL